MPFTISGGFGKCGWDGRSFEIVLLPGGVGAGVLDDAELEAPDALGTVELAIFSPVDVLFGTAAAGGETVPISPLIVTIRCGKNKKAVKPMRPMPAKTIAPRPSNPIGQNTV